MRERFKNFQLRDGALGVKYFVNPFCKSDIFPWNQGGEIKEKSSPEKTTESSHTELKFYLVAAQLRVI